MNIRGNLYLLEKFLEKLLGKSLEQSLEIFLKKRLEIMDP